jgi:hypothetical protein
MQIDEVVAEVEGQAMMPQSRSGVRKAHRITLGGRQLTSLPPSQSSSCPVNSPPPPPPPPSMSPLALTPRGASQPPITKYVQVALHSPERHPSCLHGLRQRPPPTPAAHRPQIVRRQRRSSSKQADQDIRRAKRQRAGILSRTWLGRQRQWR